MVGAPAGPPAFRLAPASAPSTGWSVGAECSLPGQLRGTGGVGEPPDPTSLWGEGRRAWRQRCARCPEGSRLAVGRRVCLEGVARGGSEAVSPLACALLAGPAVLSRHAIALERGQRCWRSPNHDRGGLGSVNAQATHVSRARGPSGVSECPAFSLGLAYQPVDDISSRCHLRGLASTGSRRRPGFPRCISDVFGRRHVPPARPPARSIDRSIPRPFPVEPSPGQECLLSGPRGDPGHAWFGVVPEAQPQKESIFIHLFRHANSLVGEHTPVAGLSPAMKLGGEGGGLDRSSTRSCRLYRDPSLSMCFRLRMLGLRRHLRGWVTHGLCFVAAGIRSRAEKQRSAPKPGSASLDCGVLNKIQVE